jgi:hypothetical protein
LLSRSGYRRGAGGHGARGRQLMEKTGDIYLISEKARCVAYWHPVDGWRDAFLCAMDLDACSSHPHLREMFIELSTEVALNRGRQTGDSVTLRVREPLSGSTTRWICSAEE